MQEIRLQRASEFVQLYQQLTKGASRDGTGDKVRMVTILCL